MLPLQFTQDIRKIVGNRAFLLYKHFGDPKSQDPDSDPGCKGDHYHLLIMGPFKTKTGNTYQASQSYLMQELKTLAQTYRTGQPSSRHVGKIARYLRYLSQEPRKLIQWSTHFDSTQATGFFEGYRWQDLPDNPTKRSKGSNTAEKDFIELQSLVERSRTTQERDFMTWAQAQDETTTHKVNNKFFRRRDFSLLFQKAVQLLAFKKREYAWGIRLQQISPNKEFMSLEDSTQLLNTWLLNQKINPYTFLSSTASILDQWVSKVNCLILHGESNAGKSIIARSLLDAFKQEEVGEVYQGVANNFMWQGCIGKRAILVEEVSISSLSMESWKLMMEGTRPVMVAVKNSPNQRLDPTPMVITCNSLPWATCTRNIDVQAFKNRCSMFKCKKMEWLRQYANKGKVHPQAWLRVEPNFWKTYFNHYDSNVDTANTLTLDDDADDKQLLGEYKVHLFLE